MPDRSTPWREAKFTVLDLETTGLDPSSHEIVSFATVTVAEGRVLPGEGVYEFVRPRHMPGPESIRIHGLLESDLVVAPPLEEKLDILIGAIADRPLIAHVAAVEVGFLSAALATKRLELLNPVIDTAVLAAELRRRRRQARGPIGLADLARSLHLPAHRPHHADGDALTTAQVFIALATHLEEFGRVTVDSLRRMSVPRRESPFRRALGRLRLSRA